MRKLPIILPAAFCLLALSCAKKSDDSGAVKSSNTTAAASTKDKATPKAPTAKPKGNVPKTSATPAVKIDAQVADAVKSARDCDLLKAAYKCEAHKKAITVVKGMMKDKGRIIAILDSLSGLALDADAKTATAARYYIGQLKSLYLLPKLTSAKVVISKATGSRLITALSKTNNKLAPSMGFAVAGVAGLTGQIDEVVKMASAHGTPGVHAAVIQHLMTYGRLRAFAAVKTAATSKDAALRTAALQAPRNMYKWRGDETQAVCPWAKPFLGDSSLKAAGNAAHLMVKCKLVDGGAYIDAMLAEGAKRVAAGQWKKPFIWAFRDVCFGGFLGSGKKPSAGTCQKTYDFLESVAKNEKVGGWLRGFALSMIYYQRRNQVTYDLLKKYKDSPVPEIKKSVEKDMASLEKNYLKKK